jgi:hypothetical protein
MNRTWLAPLALLFLAAPATPLSTGDDWGTQIISTRYVDGFRRFIDLKAEVVCYVASQGGVSCIPIRETKLDLKEVTR